MPDDVVLEPAVRNAVRRLKVLEKESGDRDEYDHHVKVIVVKPRLVRTKAADENANYLDWDENFLVQVSVGLICVRDDHAQEKSNRGDGRIHLTRIERVHHYYVADKIRHKRNVAVIHKDASFGQARVKNIRADANQV